MTRRQRGRTAIGAGIGVRSPAQDPTPYRSTDPTPTFQPGCTDPAHHQTTTLDPRRVQPRPAKGLAGGLDQDDIEGPLDRLEEPRDAVFAPPRRETAVERL